MGSGFRQLHALLQLGHAPPWLLSARQHAAKPCPRCTNTCCCLAARARLPPLQPAVVAASQAREESESLAVRLTLPPGVSSTFHENDMLLLSRDNPEVRD